MINSLMAFLLKLRSSGSTILLAALLALVSLPAISKTGPLPSWNDSATKQAIVDFVAATTTPGSKTFVPPEERIAVFDNDGTLWAEQPLYFQAFFAFDRIRALAPKHPEWNTQEPFASILKGDMKAALAGGEHALLQMVMATHAGMTTDEFDAFGNSDGDFQMLQWTTAGSGKRLGLLVHHDDAKREWAYDRQSSVGKLDKGLDAAPKEGWIVISMKNDWRQIYPDAEHSPAR